jgi:hypothetical protein
VQFAYPAWVEGAKTGMDVMKTYMDKDEKVKLEYASKYASTANYWKNRQGMIDALTKAGTAKTKAKEEAKFNKWANKTENKVKYGSVIATVNDYYVQTNVKMLHDNYLSQLVRTASYGAAPATLGNSLIAYYKENEAKKQEMLPRLNQLVETVYGKFHAPLEKDVFIAQLNLYTSKASAYGLPENIAKLKEENKGDFTAYVDMAVAKSIFATKESVLAFIKDPKPESIASDPLYVISNELMIKMRAKTPEQLKADDDFAIAFRNLVAGLRESKMNSIQYPDANSTLRLTYGKVRALPTDKRNDAAVNNYTTMTGLVKKYKAGDAEFDLPARVLELNKSKDFGEYADKDGYMPVNFLTDNDITGGNSGSPVLNGKGELTGIAFDGNIEAMAGDVIFDKKLQRTINLDIRYVLWIIDKYAGAKHIIDEMTIVR